MFCYCLDMKQQPATKEMLYTKLCMIEMMLKSSEASELALVNHKRYDEKDNKRPSFYGSKNPRSKPTTIR